MIAFTDQNLDSVRKVINKHLKAASEELGIKLSFKNMSYSDDSFTTRLTGAIIDTSQILDNGVDLSQYKNEKQGYEFECQMDDKLPKDAIGKTYELKGESLTFVGVNGRMQKNNYILVKADTSGKRVSKNVFETLKEIV